MAVLLLVGLGAWMAGVRSCFFIGVWGLLLFGCSIGLLSETWGSVAGRYYRLRKRTVNDSVLGPIVWEGEWRLHLRLEHLGGEFATTIEAPRQASPTDIQRQALRALVERQAELRQVVQEAVFQKYMECYADEDDSPQRPATPEDIWRTMEPSGIHVLDEKAQRRQEYDVMIEWNCTWDEEHGIAARFFQGNFLMTCDPGEA